MMHMYLIRPDGNVWLVPNREMSADWLSGLREKINALRQEYTMEYIQIYLADYLTQAVLRTNIDAAVLKQEFPLYWEEDGVLELWF